jgi:phosphoribosylanthranilate isomerase
VKICGITSVEDAQWAEACGADAIGVVLYSDSPRNTDPIQAAHIFASVGPFVTTVAVTHTHSREDLESILRLRPMAIQISHPFEIRTAVKVIRVMQPGDPQPEDCDAIVVDGSHGSGRLFEPDFARSTVEHSPRPVILAGGLTPGNVARAITIVRPYAVDVSSGVENRPGVKDHEKVRAFIAAAKGGGT